jgi:hypothetical protein
VKGEYVIVATDTQLNARVFGDHDSLPFANRPAAERVKQGMVTADAYWTYMVVAIERNPLIRR